MVKRRYLPWAVAGLAAVATGATAIVQAHDATAATLRPAYGAVSVEKQDPTYQYRSMPALQHITWKDRSGVTRKRFIRSFQISRDDGSLKTRVQYHVGGSLTDTGNWRHALDAKTGRRLLELTPYAKVNNVFRSGAGHTVAIDELARRDSTGRYLVRRSSADGGVRWSTTRATLTMPAGAVHPDASGRAFQRVIRLPGDRSLVMPYYAAHAKVDGKYFSAAHLLVSTNDGASWRLGRTVFKSRTNSYSESSVERRADGRLIMISRYDVVQNGKTYAKLAYRVTTSAVNDARSLAAATWGPWTPVKVPGAADYPNTVQGVAPVLHRMDQGVLMLTFGRPRNKITFSYDGGRTWTTAHSFYDNIPTSGCTSGYGVGGGVYIPCASLGSSGYMGVAVTSPRTAYVMGDNCHTNWGCAGDYRYPHGRDDKLWITTVRLTT